MSGKLFRNLSSKLILPGIFLSLTNQKSCLVQMSSANTNKTLKVYLRHDQHLEDIGKYNDPKVAIYGPQWLEEGLEILRKHVSSGTVVELIDSNRKSKEIKLDQLNLKSLQMLARNEPVNTSGEITFVLYEDVIKDRSVIFAIKDLVRQCIIIGPDKTTHFGGYGGFPKVEQDNCPVILIDLIGLQFQRSCNTGRLVLIGPHEHVGLLDQLIFTKVVGETKKTVEEAKNDKKRFVKSGDMYFDTYAYQKFVEQDFLLVCLALHDMLDESQLSKINLKFLKYGTGFFAGRYAKILDEHISRGIYLGMKQLLESDRNKIKSFEFPFFREDNELSKLCERHSVQCRFTKVDALKQTEDLMTATTNCADPHAVAGNEMNYGSVDAAIAENLKSKANKFSPIINTEMNERLIDINLNKTRQDEGTSLSKIGPQVGRVV